MQFAVGVGAHGSGLHLLHVVAVFAEVVGVSLLLCGAELVLLTHRVEVSGGFGFIPEATLAAEITGDTVQGADGDESENDKDRDGSACV